MAKKRKKQNKQSSLGIFIAVIAVFVVGTVLLFTLENSNNGASPGQETEAVDETAFQYETQQRLGKEDAPVKIVEFADFKCPACKAFTEQVFPQIQKDYIETGKASLYLINKPFIGPDSFTAAQVGEAIYAQNPDAFWNYYKKVFANQGNEKEKWATEEFLLELAGGIPNINIEELEQSIADFNEAVAQDDNIADSLQVNSTPTIFINGKPVANPFDYEGSVKPAIESALKE